MQQDSGFFSSQYSLSKTPDELLVVFPEVETYYFGKKTSNLSGRKKEKVGDKDRDKEDRERDRERDRYRDRERDKDKHGDRDKQTHTQREKERESEVPHDESH